MEEGGYRLFAGRSRISTRGVATLLAGRRAVLPGSSFLPQKPGSQRHRGRPSRPAIESAQRTVLVDALAAGSRIAGVSIVVVGHRRTPGVRPGRQVWRGNLL